MTEKVHIVFMHFFYLYREAKPSGIKPARKSNVTKTEPIQMHGIVITNNPLVLTLLNRQAEVEYKDIPFLDLLTYIRDLVHKGHKLLTHPLSGSVKPGETPYKSVLVTKAAEGLDTNSLMMIESAIASCAKFQSKFLNLNESIKNDYQLVDLEIIKGALNKT